MARNTAQPPPTRPRKGEQSSRRAKVAEVQKAQRGRERRTVLLIVAGCTAVVVLLGVVVTYGIVDARRNAEANKAETLALAIGVPAASASCDAVTTDPASGNSVHVGPGTDQPNVTSVKYSTVPPTSGSHFVQPAIDGRQFYTSQDTPAVETLVHNLEHGYTVLWYLPSEATASTASTDALKQMAEVGNKLSASSAKFIVAPWNAAYGSFPAGKKYALSHWSATTSAAGAVQSQSGHRQLCGNLSGAAVAAFVAQFPKTDSPEPLGA